jgi:hypothetical protein
MQLSDELDVGTTAMLEHVHEHIVSELQQSGKTDTVFVVTAVAFNLIVLGVNWTVASSISSPYSRSVAAPIIFPVLLAATVAVNVFCVKALRAGKKTRSTLLQGLIAMYQDNGVAKYYDPALVDVYSARYELFTYVIVALALVALVVPTIERIVG